MNDGYRISDSQFTIVLGALRSIEEKLALRFMALNKRIESLELRLQEVEKNYLQEAEKDQLREVKKNHLQESAKSSLHETGKQSP
ncbi:hypothetical protein [Chitinophaga sancti]|uniref:hypothetical protein n=1 Tax=Chitinophaga sancti TaxID=1004 RepID=UPI003F7903C1